MAAAVGVIFRSGRLIWAIGVTLVVIILLGCGVTIWDLHDETIEQQRLAVRNLGFVLAEQTSRYVQVVDFVLQEIQSRVTALDLLSPDEFTQSFETETIRNFLRERLRNLPQANAFFLVTSYGSTFITSRLQMPADRDVSDRDYYRHFATQDDPGLFISAPAQNRVTGTLAVFIARRIVGPDRRLFGIAVGAIDLLYLNSFYGAIELPPGETVTLLRRDGLVLARYPDPTHEVGNRMAASSPWHRLVAAGDGGTYRSPGFLGAIPAVVSVHPLRAWPLVIDVSMREPVALAKWRNQAMMIAGGGIGASCGFGALFGMIGLQFRRKAQQNECLAAAAAALRDSETRVLDFVEMSSDWLWELDAELRFSWVSESPMTRAMQIFDRMGMTPWQALGGDLSEPRWARLQADLGATAVSRFPRSGVG